MRNVLIGLIALGSLSAFATTPELDTLRNDKNGKLFNSLKMSSGTELRQKLANVYAENFLDAEKKYLLIKLDQHPGLVCDHLIHLADGIEVHVNPENYSKKTLITEVSEKNLIPKVYSGCGFMPYFSNEASSEAGDAIDSSVSSIVISKNEIFKPEDTSSSRKIYAKDSVYKIEKINLSGAK